MYASQGQDTQLHLLRLELVNFDSCWSLTPTTKHKVQMCTPFFPVYIQVILDLCILHI